MPDKIPTLTRKDIAKHVADQLGSSVQEAEAVVDIVLATMRTMLMSADPEIRLELRDFGVFEVKMCKAKPMARNPRTGALVFVPPRRKSHFRPGKSFKSFLAEPLGDEAESALRRRDVEAITGVNVKHHVQDLITN